VLLGAPAGFAVAAFGWVWYYVIATALAVPGLILLWWLWSREDRAAAAAEPEAVPATLPTAG
jgi:predicted MFS family arabinose efflux permease